MNTEKGWINRKRPWKTTILRKRYSQIRGGNWPLMRQRTSVNGRELLKEEGEFILRKWVISRKEVMKMWINPISLLTLTPEIQLLMETDLKEESLSRINSLALPLLLF